MCLDPRFFHFSLGSSQISTQLLAYNMPSIYSLWAVATDRLSDSGIVVKMNMPRNGRHPSLCYRTALKKHLYLSRALFSV